MTPDEIAAGIDDKDELAPSDLPTCELCFEGGHLEFVDIKNKWSDEEVESHLICRSCRAALSEPDSMTKHGMQIVESKNWTPMSNMLNGAQIYPRVIGGAISLWGPQPVSDEIKIDAGIDDSDELESVGGDKDLTSYATKEFNLKKMYFEGNDSSGRGPFALTVIGMGNLAYWSDRDQKWFSPGIDDV